MTERPSGRTCRAKNRRGQPCKRVPRENGYCVVHDPVNPQDMRAAARLGGKARRRGVGEQLPVVEALSLRETLRSGLDHQLVKSAIEQALAGGNESARVAAVKFLADLELYRKDGDECPRCAAIKAEAPAAREKMAQMLEAQLVRAVQDHDAGKLNGEHDSRAMTMVRRAVARAREGHEAELQAVVEEALLKTVERLKHANIVVENDVSPDKAKAVLAELVKIGLLRPPDETLAAERLALKAERETLERERMELEAQRAEFAAG